MSILNKLTPSRKVVVMPITLLAVLGLTAITPANGQSAFESESSAQESLNGQSPFEDGAAAQENAPVPDTKLRLFIQAQDAVDDLQDTYRRAAQNPTGDASQQLQGRPVGEEIVRTIEAHGLTVDEYNDILAEVQQTDTDTARRYHDMTRTEE